MVAYIRSDLDFILAQIKIAEAHAAGQPLYGPGGLIPTYNLSWGLRTVDGTYNNLLQPGMGRRRQRVSRALGTEFRTIMVDPDGPGGMGPMPVSYQPGVDNDGPGPADPSDVFDPYVRTISNLIVDQTLGNPSAILTGLQRAGVVDPGRPDDGPRRPITAAYEPIEAEFLAVSQSRVAYFNAATTAAANPGDAVAQQAAAATRWRPSTPPPRRWMPFAGRSTRCWRPTASSWRATTSRSRTSRRTKACRRRSTPGSRCSASSSITASTSSPRAATARCSSR